jgi:hypothetical protein
MAKLTVQRSPESWGYFYLMLGLSIGLEAAIVAMITPLVFPYNLIAFIAMAAATAYLFLRNERFQNWLVVFKIKSEKGRPH